MTFTPERERVFLQDVSVSLLFSEPILRDSITSESFLLWEDENTPVTTVRQWPSPFKMTLVGRFRPGHDYRLDVTEFDIYDLAGNVLGDSLRTYAFAIYDPDSLGSVSGEIIVVDTARQDDPVLITFDELEQDFSYQFKIEGRNFNVALPAGRYLLTGFIDSDRDGEIGNGSLFPYRLSETRARLPDTVAVRARFETAGIEFRFE